MKTKNTPTRLIRVVCFLIVLVTSLVTVVLSAGAQRWLNDRSAMAFDRDAKQLTDNIMLRTGNYADLLYSGRAFVTNSVTVTQKEWANYYKDQSVFERYRGLSSISYIEDVTVAELPSFMQKMQTLPEFGGTKYAVKPPGERQSYGLASLTVSHNDISGGLGFDLYSDPVRKEALERSQQTGQPQATHQIQFATGHKGFFMALPVYKQNVLDGYVLVAFRTEELMGELIQKTDPQIPLSIRDVDEHESRALYTSEDWKANAKRTKTDRILVAGHEWELAFAGDALYGEARAHSFLPTAVLLRGMLVTVVLLSVFWFLIKPLLVED